jgi:hypothetical protein
MTKGIGWKKKSTNASSYFDSIVYVFVTCDEDVTISIIIEGKWCVSMSQYLTFKIIIIIILK